MFDCEINCEKDPSNVEEDLSLINPISILIYFIRFISFLFNASKIILMQEKYNVCDKNYRTKNGIIIIKKKGLQKKKVILTFLKKKLLNLVLENFGHAGI